MNAPPIVIPTGGPLQAARSGGIWLRTQRTCRLWPDPSTPLRSARGDKRGARSAPHDEEGQGCARRDKNPGHRRSDADRRCARGREPAGSSPATGPNGCAGSRTIDASLVAGRSYLAGAEAMVDSPMSTSTAKRARPRPCHSEPIRVPQGRLRRGIRLRTQRTCRLWPDPSTPLCSARGDKRGARSAPHDNKGPRRRMGLSPCGREGV